MPGQVDPQFRADHEDFRQLIGDGRLNPAEQRRVGAIIDRINAYRLGSQQGPVGSDAHSAAASDLGRVASRLAPESPRVAAPLATYAMVHDQAAQRRASPSGAASMNPYGDGSGQTAPAVNTAQARVPYDFASGFPSGKYDEFSKLGDLVPDAWSRGPAQRHVFGQGTQFAENQPGSPSAPDWRTIDWSKYLSIRAFTYRILWRALNSRDRASCTHHHFSPCLLMSAPLKNQDLRVILIPWIIWRSGRTTPSGR